MKKGFSIALALASSMTCGLRLHSQAPPAPPQQSKPSDPQKPPANPQKPPAESNPFPEDTNNVPLMPSGGEPAVPNEPSNGAAPSSLSTADVDPVRSPDDPQPDANTDAEGFSSSTAGLERVVPPPDTDTRSGKRGKNQPASEHQETAAEDEKVGDYYLSQKNWKAALSRYESAVVLDPENPEVYWGLGEAQRHLGSFAEAKTSYQKLIEYDPDSKHSKEARKLLKDPELASANTSSAAKPRVEK
jgi:tetratricopeptide (TPR) repeat protein